MTEAAWLLRAHSQYVSRLLQYVADGHVEVIHLDVESAQWMAGFFTKYADQPAQLADASLVYLAEHLGIDRVFTLDRRDFSIYRTTEGRALRVVPD